MTQSWYHDPRMLAAGNARGIPGGEPDFPDARIVADEWRTDGAIVKVRPGDGAYPSRRTVVYIRNHPAPGLQWRGTDGSHMRDDQVRTFFREDRATLMERGTE